MSAISRRRLLASALVVLALLTLAPRTSEIIGEGWTAQRLADTSGGDRGGLSTFTFWAIPPEALPATSRIPIFVSGAEWDLVSAPAGCTDEGIAVVCIVESSQVRSKHLITVVVRSDGPISFSFAAPQP